MSAMAWEYADIDMGGIPERLYLPISRHVQEAFREFHPDVIRVIWNERWHHPTLVIRNPSIISPWHDGLMLRGWAILGHWEHEPIGDGTRAAAWLRSGVRAADYGNDPEKAEEEQNRRILAAREKAEAESRQRTSDLADDHFNQRPEAIAAFDREVAKAEERELDNTRRHSSRKKVKVPVRAATCVEV